MALVQLYVVLCVGPIFFSLAKIDKAILEAARDMGAIRSRFSARSSGRCRCPAWRSA